MVNQDCHGENLRCHPDALVCTSDDDEPELEYDEVTVIERSARRDRLTAADKSTKSTGVVHDRADDDSDDGAKCKRASPSPSRNR